MKHKSYILFGLMLVFSLHKLSAQDLSIMILSEADGFPTTVMISNPTSLEKEVRLKLIARKNGSLFVEKADQLKLSKEQTRFRIREYLEDIGYGQQSPEQVVSWELCAELYDPASKQLASSCQPMQAQPVLPPHLVYPFDKDELLTPLPTFTWTAPGPVLPPQPVYYSLKVVELQGFYPPKVAINSLPAFYERENLGEQLHPYTPAGQAFEIGKEYAWQIHAYTAQGRDLGMSEVWTFRLKGEEEEEKEDSSPYVELRRTYDAGYYPAFGQIKFKFDCDYAEKVPVFHISNQRGDMLRVSSNNLIRKGKNLFNLQLPPGSGFIEGQYYFFEVEDRKGGRTKLMFRYFYPQTK